MATPDITDAIEIDGTPGTPNGAITPSPSQAVVARAGSTREYVAGATLQWYANLPHALPWALDDVSTDFGADVYQRMLMDAQVRSAVNVLKASVLEEGIQLAPAVQDSKEDGYKQAVQIADDASAMLDDLSPSLDDVLWDMADAIALGNRVGELVFALDRTLSGKQQYGLQSVAVKPRESIAFVVDAYLNLLGLLGRIPGQPFGVQQGTILTNLADNATLLPRAKFAILTHRPQNGDPRGTSVLRPCFSAWQAKVQIFRDYLKYLAQFATPSIVGFTPDTADPYQMVDASGALMYDIHGNPIMRTPEDDMLAALEAFANGTATAFPGGARVQPIEMNGSGNAFTEAFQFYDRQISKAILQQTLATDEGQHQTRASSGTHKDILDTIVRQAKRPIERMVQRDILQTWIRLNYGDRMLKLTPRVTLGSAEQEDYAPLWTAMAALQSSGYVAPSQYPDLDEMIGFPKRDMSEQAASTPPQAGQPPVNGATNVPQPQNPPPSPGAPQANQ